MSDADRRTLLTEQFAALSVAHETLQFRAGADALRHAMQREMDKLWFEITVRTRSA